MSNISFSNVTGFNLKWPSRFAGRPLLSNKGEWIEINKQKNKLPTARLRTWVLYYRFNGDPSGGNVTLTDPEHTDLDSWKGNGIPVGDPGAWSKLASPQPNFRFYNNYVSSLTDMSGGQLGSIWGFPLFNVGPNGEKDIAADDNYSTNTGLNTLWPFFGSCITGITKDTNGNVDVSGNERMLVNISDQRNIIVIDFSGYDDNNSHNKFADIKNNLNPYVTDGFYMTLRVKTGTERLVPATGADSNGNGKHFHAYTRNSYWTYTTHADKFCSLVEYIYDCDIIGPKPMLDFTLNYFSYFSTTGKLFGDNVANFSQNTNKRLAIPIRPDPVGGETPESTANYYTTDISLNIITGLKYHNVISHKNRMDTEYIYSNLTVPGWKMVLIQKQNYFNNSYSGESLCKLIGGMHSYIIRKDYQDVNTQGGGTGAYYGSNYGEAWNYTSSKKTESWQWDINLQATDSLNKWPNTLTQKSYDLNNILWCSLRSPKKVPVLRIAGVNNVKQYRFVTNFIDISGTYSVGGGYGRYTNTLDMPRKSLFPYYSSIVNNNCVSIKNYNTVSSNSQYLDSIGSELPPPDGGSEFDVSRNIHEIGNYKIYYKLLIPPMGSGSACSISYTFGKSINSKVTFFRYTDMSGSPTPPKGSNPLYPLESSIWANMDSESILLKWETGNTDIQSIILTDVASGTSKHSPIISYDDSNLNKTRDTTSSLKEDYDLSFNIFQVVFNAIDNDGNLRDRGENTYSIQIFDSNSSTKQYTDISYVPQNYVPYRYIDLPNLKLGSNISSESIYYWPETYLQPIYIIDEKIKYNVDKVYPRQAGEYDFTKDPPFVPSTTSGTARFTYNLPRAVILDPSSTRIVDEINIDISNTLIDVSYSVVASSLPDRITTAIAQEEIAIFTKNKDGGKNIFSLDTTNLKIIPTGLQSQNDITFYPPLTLTEYNYLIPDYWRLPSKINSLRKNDQGASMSYNTNYGVFSKWENQTLTNAVYDILNVILKGIRSDNTAGEIGGLLLNSNKDSIEWSAVDTEGTLITGNLIFEVQGSGGLPPGSTLNERPIVVQLTTSSTGPFGSSAINYIGDTAGGTTTGIKNKNFDVGTILPATMRQGNNNGNNFPNTNEESYNGLFNISMKGWEEIPVLSPPRQNPFYNNISISPSPLISLLVDIPGTTQTNGADYHDMISSNNETVTIKWTGFYFSNDTAWNTFPLGQDGDIEWTISRYNLSTGISKVRYTGLIPFNLSTKEYIWEDKDIVVYDKYRWTVGGTYKWYGITKLIPGSAIPSINVPGFTTPDCFICKFNRFQYGRFNTTSTNLKLYAPLKIDLPEGQVNQFGKKVCGGGCKDPNNPSLKLFSRGPRISSSNNIYANTTNQLSKKQTYVLLAKSRFRPTR